MFGFWTKGVIMKLYAHLVFAVALFASVGIAASRDQVPPITAVEVAQIAQQDLVDRGLQDEIYIQEIAYKSNLGSPFWDVIWNRRFPSQTKGHDEVGLKVRMDGNYTRKIKK